MDFSASALIRGSSNYGELENFEILHTVFSHFPEGGLLVASLWNTN
jgi:hypothetical protein